MMTVLEVIQAATHYLEEREVPDARLNAEHLVGHSLGLPRLQLYLQFDRPLGDAERQPIRELVRRRGSREPLQHLLQSSEFLGKRYGCDARALIPRPETEQLAELLIDRLRPAPPSRIADIGTGSGVLALALASAFPQAEVLATDRCPQALSLARENAAQHGLERIAFLEWDLLPSDRTFDLIVSNPPYIARGALPDLQPEVRFDPPMALDGGPDGLEVLRRIAPAASHGLETGGTLALEIGADQGPAVRALLEAENYRDIELLEDYQKRVRFVFAAHG